MVKILPSITRGFLYFLRFYTKHKNPGASLTASVNTGHLHIDRSFFRTTTPGLVAKHKIVASFYSLRSIERQLIHSRHKPDVAF